METLRGPGNVAKNIDVDEDVDLDTYLEREIYIESILYIQIKWCEDFHRMAK